jgi:hypothetical protein
MSVVFSTYKHLNFIHLHALPENLCLFSGGTGLALVA